MRHRGPKVVLVNQCVSVPAADVATCAAALQRQANEHFALAWGIGVASVRAAGARPGASVTFKDEWAIVLLDTIDVADALGYHDETESGLPLAKVCPPLDLADGSPWQATASHELLEMLADPYLRRGAQRDNGWFEAIEVCDRVERDIYEIDGVSVSDFLLPAAFEPPSLAPTPAGWDWLGLLKRPDEIRPGGYCSLWDGGKWVDRMNGEKRSFRRLHKGRSHRRGFASKYP